jgi:hypothetical protein
MCIWTGKIHLKTDKKRLCSPKNRGENMGRMRGKEEIKWGKKIVQQTIPENYQNLLKNNRVYILKFIQQIPSRIDTKEFIGIPN